MSELTLTLLTRAGISEGSNPLDRIWDLDNWKNSLKRVRDIRVLSSTDTYQHFLMHFDADRDQPDIVEVERNFSDSVITVKHLIPPAGLLSLQAEWWIDNDIPDQLFARRKITMEENHYSEILARKMFLMLRENMSALTGNKS